MVRVILKFFQNSKKNFEVLWVSPLLQIRNFSGVPRFSETGRHPEEDTTIHVENLEWVNLGFLSQGKINVTKEPAKLTTRITWSNVGPFFQHVHI